MEEASSYFNKGLEMIEKMEYVIQQSVELRKAADDVWELRRSVNQYEGILQDAWRSKDALALKEATNRLQRMLNGISNELYEIAHDVMVSSQGMQTDSDD